MGIFLIGKAGWAGNPRNDARGAGDLDSLEGEYLFEEGAEPVEDEV